MASDPRLDALADDIYFDGTYEWEKDGKEWHPIQAPYGMPPEPRFEDLSRVQKVYKPLDDERKEAEENAWFDYAFKNWLDPQARQEPASIHRAAFRSGYEAAKRR